MNLCSIDLWPLYRIICRCIWLSMCINHPDITNLVMHKWINSALYSNLHAFFFCAVMNKNEHRENLNIVSSVRRHKLQKPMWPLFCEHIHCPAWLVVDWMRTIIKSTSVQQRCTAPLNDSVTNPKRRFCFADSSWGLRVAQVLAWKAVVGAGFRQPVVSRTGTTRGYQAGAPTPRQLFHN